MKILLIGSGGREHALAWKLAQSPHVERLWCAPGNAGTEAVATNVACGVDDIDGLIGFAQEAGADLVVVGPEAPLAEGLADRLKEAGIDVFGPSEAAARLETSKAFAKDFMRRYKIPTAGYGVFENADEARAFLDRLEAPYVLKADGLAAGKGVVIAQSREEAEAAIDDMLSGKFGDASRTLVIEEFLHGEEASFFALCDGTTAVPFGASQDHKRAFDGDAGPNTGGMGAFSPTPAFTAADQDAVMETIVRPTLAGMAAEGAPFSGVLFVGLMMTAAGPKVVEFNVRFGDPECQTLMLRLQSDLADLLRSAARGRLAEAPAPDWDERCAVNVVMAAKGYPGSYEKGTPINGLEAAQELPGVAIFHAGTARDGDVLRAVGGRVLNICAIGETTNNAVERAYAAVDAIKWPEGFCRRDIARRALDLAQA